MYMYMYIVCTVIWCDHIGSISSCCDQWLSPGSIQSGRSWLWCQGEYTCIYMLWAGVYKFKWSWCHLGSTCWTYMSMYMCIYAVHVQSMTIQGGVKSGGEAVEGVLLLLFSREDIKVEHVVYCVYMVRTTNMYMHDWGLGVCIYSVRAKHFIIYHSSFISPTVSEESSASFC